MTTHVGSKRETHFLLKDIRTLFLLIFAILSISFLRRPDSILNPQFYAEDSTIVFREYYEIGLSALFISASGYLIVLQRLVGSLIMALVPYEMVPLFFNLASIVITLAVVLSVLSPRIPLKNKPLFALAVVLVPHYNNEVFNNLVCSQWIVAISLVLLLIKSKPSLEHGNIYKQYAIDLSQVIVFGLSGPFLLLFSPLFLVRAALERDRYSTILLAVVLACSGLQTFHLLSAGLSSAAGNSPMTFSVLKAVFGMKLFGNMVMGPTLPYLLPRTLLAAIYVLFMVLILKISAHKGPAVFYFLAAHCAVILSALIKFRNIPETLVPAANGPRYFYLPYLMVSWGLIMGINHKERWKAYFCRISLVTILFSAIATNFYYEPFVDYKWKEHAAKIGKEDVEIPVNPKGWKLKLKARPDGG